MRTGRTRRDAGRTRARALAAVLLATAAACGPRPRPAVTVVELGGAWEMRAARDTAWTPATVPGTVHTDLLGAGRIPDPLHGDREAELAWIEDEDWIYRRNFELDRRLLEEQRLDLVLEGLDTYAEVLLNGTRVLAADNQFRTWRVDVRDAVRAGPNTLEVRFASAVREGARRAAAHPWPIPHQEPDASGTRAFTRKAAYAYGWDWGPRFVTAGIWRPVRLEAWSGVRIVDAWAAPPTWSGDTAEVALAVELEAAGAGTVRLGVRSPGGAFASHLVATEVSSGDTVVVERTLVVPGARAWWPRGTGEEPGTLYEIAVDVAADRRWDRATRRIGLRTIELETEPDSLGESFRFVVNGRPVFARGANVVPPDPFLPRADSATYARLVDDAARANMNMLRIWGGGVYLPDVFYDLADAQGILVWQDFMFANTLVPEDPAYVASVAAEARDQVRRLRRHAGLALWCGNNEVAEGWANWGWRDPYAPEVAARVEAAYRRVFEEVLPEAVRAEAPWVDYRPSSPRHGWGRPESLTEGDSHYWGVWWGLEPFRVYAEKVPRFASEFGFQALPDPVTLASFGDPAPTALSDPLMRAHQKHPAGYETIRTYVEREWPVPHEDSLDAWSWVSQRAQAEGVGLALEAHRRSWPRTGGTLFWQLNDTWPAVSWASVDAAGRWKALQHEAARVFAPVAVLADRWADTLAVWVAADAGVSGTLELRVLDFEGRERARREVRVAGAGLAWRGTRGELLPEGTDARSVVALARLLPGAEPPPPDAAAPSDREFFVPPRELLLPEPGLSIVSAAPEGDAWLVAFTAAGFAYGVRLSLDGVGARFSPDWIDVLPGDTVRVLVEPERPVSDLRRLLRLRSLR